VLKRDKKAGIH